MNISIDKLLTKIAEELNLARTCGKPENLREKVYSIKILCELILDEQQISPMNQPKKPEIEIDGGQNGGSLLDF